MQLSEQQAQFFETFGYLSFPGAFAAEAEAISEEFERVWAERGGRSLGTGARPPTTVGLRAIYRPERIPERAD